MDNALAYLNWRGDLSFDQFPFNEVDMFICSQLSTPSYYDIITPLCPAVYIRSAIDKYFSLHPDNASLGVLQSEYIIPMLRALLGSDRYKNILLAHASSKVKQENSEQFSAVTIILPDGSVCISYRGTDDTIIGWKEDFRLATHDCVPAQNDALDYLNMIAALYPGKIHICGHSKGGNLAVFAASMAQREIQSRIADVYNFDGPGFSTRFLETDGYLFVKDRIKTILSQNSLVGTLMNAPGQIIYVNACKSGPIAHDGFTWEIKTSSFVRSGGLSDGSRAFDKAMDETLSSLSTKEKDAFIDELFDTLLSTGAVTLTELSGLNISETISLLRNFHSDREVHSFTLKVGEAMIKAVCSPFVEEHLSKYERSRELIKNSITHNIEKRSD